MTLIHKRAKISQREPATLVVAASNSKNKQSADYICPGTDDLDYITNTVVPQIPTAGGTILLLEGTYYMSTNNKPLTVNGKNSVIIRGQGYGTNISFASTGFTCSAIQFTSCTGSCGIHDLSVSCNSAGASSWILYINGTGMTDASITGCSVSGGSDYGIIIYQGSPNIVITNNVITAASVRGIFNGSSNGAYIAGNYIYSCTGVGICAGGAYSHVIGNTLYNNTTQIQSYGDLFSMISDNTCYGGTYGVYVYTSRSGVIANNALYSTNGVYFQSANDYTVTGNRFYNGTYGVYIDAGSTRMTIRDNAFEHTDVSVVSGKGVYIASSACKDIDIRNNHYYGWVSGCWIAGNYVVEGTNTIGTRDAWFDLAADTYVNIAACNSGAVDTVVLTSGMPVAISLTNQPDVPRNLSLNMRDADTSISGITISITGYDAKGLMWTDSYTASGDQVRAWATLVSASVTEVYGESSGDVLYVGYGSKLGLVGTIGASSDVFRVTRDGTPITTSGYSVNASYDTVDISGITLGTDIIVEYRKNTNSLPRS